MKRFVGNKTVQSLVRRVPGLEEFDSTTITVDELRVAADWHELNATDWAEIRDEEFARHLHGPPSGWTDSPTHYLRVIIDLGSRFDVDSLEDVGTPVVDSSPSIEHSDASDV